MNRFSERFGLTSAPAEITVRHDAPEELRGVLVDIAYRNGYRPISLRSLLCQVLYKRPDPSNWSEYPNIDGENRGYLEDCPWYEVYDIVEALGTGLAQNFSQAQAQAFEADVNRYFERAGIGWKLVQGRLEVRGAEAFEVAVREAQRQLQALGKHTSAQELHEAILDLSRRPSPEITGAIQHALAALECTARDATMSKDTLGDLLRRNPNLFPRPIDTIVDKAWGWTSNFGRHLQEGQPPSFEEAELMVGLSGVLCRYLGHKL